MYVYCSCCNHKFGQYLSNQARPSPGETGLSSGVKQTATVYEMTSLCGASLSNILKRLNSVVNIDRVCSLFDQLTKKNYFAENRCLKSVLTHILLNFTGWPLVRWSFENSKNKLNPSSGNPCSLIPQSDRLLHRCKCLPVSISCRRHNPDFSSPSFIWESLDSSFTRRFVWFVYCFPDAYFV